MVCTRRIFPLLVLAWLLIAGLAQAGPNNEADDRVDAFLDETSQLFGPSEAAIVKRLGPPLDRQAVPFTSPHDETPYEVITLGYDGLILSLFSMDAGQRQFFHQISITAGKSCFARGICRGTPRERLRQVLGAPEDDQDGVWRYSDASGYNELSFTFDANGAIDSLTWTAEAD